MLPDRPGTIPPVLMTEADLAASVTGVVFRSVPDAFQK